jgi:hypothetical protein
MGPKRSDWFTFEERTNRVFQLDPFFLEPEIPSDKTP